jgi:ABC-type multidrug transport system ATPase subunit
MWEGETMNRKPIELNNVTKKYGKKLILDNVTFALDWKSCTWLAGSNGSGKSTIIKHILGLVKPTTGSVLLNGLDPYYCSSARRYIGFILDKDGVDPLLSTLDNLVFYTKLYIGRKLPDGDYDGQVIYNAAVEEILVKENRAVGVRLADGREYRADIIVSAADGYSTIFKLLGGRYVDDKIKKRYTEWELCSLS